MRILSLAGLLAGIALAGAGRAQALDLEPIDCASSPFGYAGETYNVDCERSSQNMHVDETTGSVQVDVMTITSEDRQVFLTVVSQLILAPRIYLEHRGLSQSFHDTFEHAEPAEWKGVGNKNGYDLAEFSSEVSGQISKCIAIQRYTNPAWTGYKRHIIGMGCGTAGLDAVYDILGKLTAPGD